MAGWSLEYRPNRLLSGLFGTLQTAAVERASTADVWGALRETAAEWSLRAQGLPPAATSEEAQTIGARVLSEQGVGPINVSVWRGEAGQWRSAKESLHALDEDAQIRSSEVFTAPWSRTAEPGVPARYRLKTQWQVEGADGETVSVWKTDEVAAPLTNKRDLLQQATEGELPKSPAIFQMAAAPPELLDYELEQV